MAIARLFGHFTLISDVQGSLEEPNFLTKNAFDLRSYYQRLLTRISFALIFRKTDYFIACSYGIGRQLIKRGIDRKKICVIRNGVDTEVFRPGKQKSTTNAFTVTYAGGFQMYQGLENLLEAAHRLKNADIKFRIIGFRQSNFALREKIRRDFRSKVELVDFMPQREKLVFYLQTSDVLIIPRSRNSATESAFPTKFAEYLAIGRPLIVTDVDETAELVRRYDCGFVCKPNADSIAEAITEARETPPARMNQMGRNGRRLAVTEFDQKVLGKIYFRDLLRIREKESN
jgi:glycosyltransferase involved in cell wall biosynthesis